MADMNMVEAIRSALDYKLGADEKRRMKTKALQAWKP